MTTSEILQTAKKTTAEVSLLTAEQKRQILNIIADELGNSTDEILKANSFDLASARGNISEVMTDRLLLDESRIFDMADGIRAVAELPEPTGVILNETVRPNGIRIKKVTVPLGVVAVIYESRPNVTADAAALCLKSGNVCVLRTGKHGYRSAFAIVSAMQRGLQKCGVSSSCINLIEESSHESAKTLMEAVGLVDLLIPRGGKSLIKACVENAKVPCIQTGTGICHIYVDRFADFNKALNIIENAKCSRPSVCNAAECLLIDEKIYNDFLPELYKRLVEERKSNKVKFKLDEKSFGVLAGKYNCFEAEKADFDCEFLDYILAIKVVDGVKSAVEHIAAHSTGHSECIVTENADNADYFTRRIDSAAVYVNVSTRFTDGEEFGFGCEVGISTQKLHARGPMGLAELTSYKYIVTGNGQIR